MRSEFPLKIIDRQTLHRIGNHAYSWAYQSTDWTQFFFLYLISVNALNNIRSTLKLGKLFHFWFIWLGALKWQ